MASFKGIDEVVLAYVGSDPLVNVLATGICQQEAETAQPGADVRDLG